MDVVSHLSLTPGGDLSAPVNATTWVKVSEIAEHHLMSQALNVPVYFCDLASPGSRATNEKTNGMQDRYLPMATDRTRYIPNRPDGSGTRRARV